MTIIRMKQRRGATSEWVAANPILSDGEIGYSTDTQLMKVGDGVTAWSGLPFFNAKTLGIVSARLLDAIIVGTITRDSNDAATSAPVVWPDGTVGVYTATVLSAAFPGAVDAYTVTYGSPVTKTYTQPTLTRNANGAVTVLPAIVVT